ncbi:MAG: UDP-2,4-diacetamido-2,4,6-trideoxy-beta-L-altropyranose hydrolase [Solirubrobacteraceae bacterium]
MTGPTVLIRADASPAIGMGHAMRCLALAEAFVQETDGHATFLMARPSEAFVARAASAGAEVRPLAAQPASPADREETAAVSGAIGASWLVLDGYAFDGDFQAALVAGGQRVLALDDYGHAGHYSAQLVLNPNAGADATRYEARGPDTRLLLGPEFALLRDEFRRWSAPPPAVPTRARRVVITFGGGDPANVSMRVLGALAAVPGPLEVLLLVGAANPHTAALRAAAARSPHSVGIEVDVRDMARRLAWADLAVAAAGGTMLELARVATPQVSIVLADNQAPGAAAMARAGAAINLGRDEDLSAAVLAAEVAALADDAPRRAELSRRGRATVDGRGALRVLAAMRSQTATGAAAA